MSQISRLQQGYRSAIGDYAVLIVEQQAQIEDLKAENEVLRQALNKKSESEAETPA